MDPLFDQGKGKCLFTCLGFFSVTRGIGSSHPISYESGRRRGSGMSLPRVLEFAMAWLDLLLVVVQSSASQIPSNFESLE